MKKKPPRKIRGKVAKRNYDVAFQAALNGLARTLVTLLRGGKRIASIVSLNVEHKKWLERQADALFRIVFRDGTQWLLHIEIQATNDPKIGGRMMIYGGLDHLRYNIRPYQLVLYIGLPKMRMPDMLPE